MDRGFQVERKGIPAMGPEQPRLTSAERSDLVAYLDGELGEAAARAIASKVTTDPATRREVEALRAAWSLLDLLPEVKASPDLETRTLTAIGQLAVSSGPRPPVGRVPGGGRARWFAACLAATVLAAGLGFAVTRRAWPDPDARLVRQLSLAEHLDEYRDVGTFEFLQRLDESPDFDDPE